MRASQCGARDLLGAGCTLLNRRLMTGAHRARATISPSALIREVVMGEIKLFQICYEGELTVGVSHAMRRLGAEPNFDQSWHVWLPEGRHAAPLVRWMRTQLGPDARLLVAATQFTTTRDFL